MIPPTRIHELARRTAQRFVNDEDPGQRLYIFEASPSPERASSTSCPRPLHHPFLNHSQTCSE